MIIHLTGSSRYLEEDLPYLQKITQLVTQNGCTLVNDWVEDARTRTEATNPADWPTIMNGMFDAISRSDVMIVEGTRYGFMQGYQTALALLQKKPVLVISREPLVDRSIMGVKNRLLTVEKYDSLHDLDAIVSNFIKANTISTKDLRFNMFIDRPIYNHLRNLSYESGKNRSEIIRDLIYKDMHNKDD